MDWMKVAWREEEPPVKSNGMSKQLILLTSLGNFATGYWSSNRCQWYVDGLIASKEYVVAWLDMRDD